MCSLDCRAVGLVKNCPVRCRFFAGLDGNRVARDVEFFDFFGHPCWSQLNFFVAQKRPPKAATANEILILFAQYLAALLQLIQFVEHVRSYLAGIHFVGAGFAEELQRMTFSVVDEFVKVEWLINLAQVVMKECLIPIFCDALKFRLQDGDVGIRIERGVG